MANKNKTKNKGKEKCNFLKEMRRKLAEKLGIDLKQKECTFEGQCTGTCPKCQEEELILNNALLEKETIKNINFPPPPNYPEIPQLSGYPMPPKEENFPYGPPPNDFININGSNVGPRTMGYIDMETDKRRKEEQKKAFEEMQKELQKIIEENKDNENLFKGNEQNPWTVKNKKEKKENPNTPPISPREDILHLTGLIK